MICIVYYMLAHVSWVGYVLHRSCATTHNGAGRDLGCVDDISVDDLDDLDDYL